jgi:hypothetical protein
LALPKAFQTNAKRLFGFFNAHPLNQAYHFVIGFVATLGTSLDEFAGDVRAILDAKLKNL